MSSKDILGGILFVVAGTFTVMILMTIGFLWWDHFKQRKDK